ncbi:MAG TPA: tetratricopeptide repeat protein [Vicinamibacterales bacterium]|nr:tetratricopeptide repeat protein [Vicinamibacterales bacterium]
MKRWTVYFAGLVVSVGLSSGCARKEAQAAAAPSVNLDPCAAALAQGPERDDRDRAIARLQQLARSLASPEGEIERLGYAYVARARVSSDPGDYTLAERAAACLERRRPGDPAALLLKGHVLHQLHRFAEAERIARDLVARRSFVLDYGLLGDAVMEQGRLDEAADVYQKMIDLKPFYQSYTRAAHLRWLKGDLDGAIDVMRLAIGAASPRDPESAAWAWTRLAAYELQADRAGAAATAAQMALRYQPDYPAALLVQGRIFLATDRPADAVAVLRNAARLNPLPEYQWTLADALRLQRLDDEATAIEAEMVARGRITDPRTLSLYLATRRMDAPTAIALAEEELRARRDVFTLDAHAWALAASGRIREALPVITRAVAEGTEDARLFLHAGLINAAAGRGRDAKRWLNKAEHLRSMLLPSELEELDKSLTGTARESGELK